MRPAPLRQMLAAQTRFELSLVLRNGEQLLLTMIIPLLLLVLLSTVPIIDVGDGPRVDAVAPGILALTVMSTAFTSLAIATGFERRYGLLKLLWASPLPRWTLMLAKVAAVVVVEVVQVLLVVGVGYALGWRPEASWPWVGLLLLAGTAAFAGLGLWMAGTLKAEVTLAAANLVYLVLLVLGGVVVPLDRFPDALAAVAALTPTGALTEGLRAVINDGATAWAPLGVLVAWAVVGLGAATRFFRWE